MKKIVSVALVLGSLSIGSTSFARGGNDPARGTQGWFVEESVEHVIRKLAATKIQSLEVVLTGAEDSVVTVTKADGDELAFNCFMFDESSRSGTVLKKEVLCR